MSTTAFDRRVEAILKKSQQELMPEHANEFLCINMQTGEYTLGKTYHEAQEKFRALWPKGGWFGGRVDGGPAVRMLTPRIKKNPQKKPSSM